MRAAIFCALEADEIRKTLKELQSGGIPDRDVSILCPDVPALEGVYSDPAGGLLPNATSLIVEGIGPCVVSGPVAHMLAGTPAGQLVSGLTAAPNDLGKLMGIPDTDHPVFIQHLRTGRGILLVHYEEPEQRRNARAVFLGKGIPKAEIRVAGLPALSAGRRGTVRSPI